MQLFRHCPSCGRRFHIKLVSKESLASNRETIENKEAVLHAWPTHGGEAPGPPIIVAREELEYRFKCAHCGHEWSEKRIEKHRGD